MFTLIQRNKYQPQRTIKAISIKWILASKLQIGTKVSLSMNQPLIDQYPLL